MIQLLLWSIIRPKDSIITGGTWRIPVMHQLLDKNFVKDLKADGTYLPETFQREYESIWSGTTEGSYFNASDFDKARVLKKPCATFADIVHLKNSKIIFGFDVGRTNDYSSLIVMQIVKSVNGTYTKKILNVYSLEKMHFHEQTVFIKQKVLDFGPDKIVIDGMGMGIGLIDFLSIETPLDPKDTDRDAIVYPRLGIDRKSDKLGTYKSLYFEDGEYSDIIYIVKASDNSNSEMHKTLSMQLSSGKIQFLIDEKLAKDELLASKEGKEMTPEERAEFLKPFIMTSILRTEMMNLKKINEDTQTTTLKRAKSTMPKDKFSALESIIYYVRNIEMEGGAGKGCGLGDLITMTKTNVNQRRGGKVSMLEKERERSRNARAKPWRN